MLVNLAQAQIFFLAITRVFAILIHIPVLGGNAIPSQIRLGLGLLLTLVLVPWQILPPGAETLPLLAFAMAILRELIIGTLAGFAADLTFGAVQMAGEMMSTGAGFSSGRTLNPLIGESGSAMDQLFTMTALLLFLVIDGHHILLMALKRTFELIPLSGSMPAFSGDALIALTVQLILLGIQMSLPVVGALLLTDITLGLLARVAPQIQVFFLGIPAKIGLGLIAFSLTLAILMPRLSDTLRSIGPWMLKLLGS